jgi:hypothetical protein
MAIELSHDIRPSPRPDRVDRGTSYYHWVRNQCEAMHTFEDSHCTSGQPCQLTVRLGLGVDH